MVDALIVNSVKIENILPVVGIHYGNDYLKFGVIGELPAFTQRGVQAMIIGLTAFVKIGIGSIVNTEVSVLILNVFIQTAVQIQVFIKCDCLGKGKP